MDGVTRASIELSRRCALALTLMAALALGCAGAADAKRRMPPDPPAEVQRLETPLRDATTVQKLADAGAELPSLPRRIAKRYHTLRIPARHEPRGLVLVLHGGGWWWRGRGVTLASEADALEYYDQGFAVLNVDFGWGAQIRGDVTAWFDWARKAFPKLPICVAGGSSGGSVALSLAAWRRRVRCVIALGPVTDLLVDKPNWAQRYMLKTYARPVFRTKRRLRRYSPRTVARRVRARVLVASAETDPAAPCSELRRYRRAARRARVRVMCLESGSQTFMHLGVSKHAIGGFKYVRDATLDKIARPVCLDPYGCGRPGTG